MKRILILLASCMALNAAAQTYSYSYRIDTTANHAVRISDSIGNSRVYPPNTLYIDISHDST